jgi:hypothetical protein
MSNFRNALNAAAVSCRAGAVFAVCIAAVTQAAAAPVFSAAAVVTVATHTATFDALNSSNLPLHAYQEAGINVTVPAYNYVGFQPFNSGTSTGYHYGGGGNSAWVDITLAGGGTIHALDFLLGDGWSNTSTNLIWETFTGGTSTGFGDVVINKGSTVGWNDAAGFTRLRVAANASGLSAFGNYQAIALDNLRIGTSGVALSAQAVPEPATLGLVGLSLVGIWAARRKA